ncbi:MAG: DUF4864 domain-containing protein [Pseudomonadota bacterium]
MRKLTAALLAFVLTSPAALWAQTAQEAIQSVIAQQLDAFRASDVPQAFTFAAPSIQSMFQSPERFGQMVRDGYPMVWQPGPERYLETEATPGGQSQIVMIPDADGQMHFLRYSLIETDGTWRINGVWVLRSEALGA